MNWKRIITVAVLAAAIPLLVGFLFGLFGGAAGGESSAWLYQVRVWSIRVLLLLPFVWLGRVQRERLVSHAVIAVCFGWAIAELMSFAVFRTMGWLAAKETIPPVPEWSLDGAFLLYLAGIAAVGVACGYAIRLASARRTGHDDGGKRVEP